MSIAQLSNIIPAGYGLMNFTWVASRKFTPEEFNQALKTVLDKSGATVEKPLFLNGGEFYGIPERHENIKLLGGFFEKHPEYADKVFVSIKSGVDDHWAPDTSSESLSEGVDAISKYLQPLFAAREQRPKALDMYTLARVGNDPIEKVVTYLAMLASQGRFKSICLSEVSAKSITQAASVAPIAAVEIEFSLFHREALENGVLAKCVELNIPVVCYSPLGKGLLVGQKASDLAKDDMRHNFDKFNDPEVAKHNQVLVDKVSELASREKITPAQLAISWITTLSGKKHNGVQYPQLIPIPGSTNPERQLNNIDTVELNGETLREIDETLSSFKTKGHRYNEMIDSFGYK